MLVGFDTAATAVSGTLGPKGRNVWIDDPMAPKFTNDGATIATNVVLKDPLEDSGAKILKNTCGQTLDDAGDGTTTSAVLIHSIVHECLRRPENPMEIRESLLKASPKIVKELRKVSKPITVKEVKKVALISAENEELADNISQIIEKIGSNAVITVEDSIDPNISYEIVAGYEAAVGFVDPRFADPKDKKARCILTDVPVLVSEKKISALSDVQALWTKFKDSGVSSCVIVCDDIENSMIGVFLASKYSGSFNALVIRATGDLLKDIEAAVGATRISDTTGVNFQNVSFEHLGRVKKVVCDANNSLFISDDPMKSELYATHLERFAKTETNMYIKTKLERRIAQLRGGVAVLKIGTQDFNREYLKDKADDAIKAAKSALEEGVVEGGGMAFWRIANAMKPKTIGEEILKKALTAPLRKIIENANKDYTEIVFNNITLYRGYDAKNDLCVDMFDSGIIDPTKVERCALENAISNAANFITMSASITEHVDDKK
jgi:chaperonin GroEL